MVGCLLFVLLLCAVQARLMYIELDNVSAAQLSLQLNDQHIVMVGDSLTRYQYLSLVYLVHFNSFYNVNDTVPNILIETTFNSWSDYYNTSNKLFSPNEYCDCFRGKKKVLKKLYENRYYHDKERNLTISYMQYFGDQVMPRGHWQPSDNETNHQQHAPDYAYVPFHWEYADIEDAIANIAAKLQPKPSVLLLNAGHWANSWDQPSHRDRVLSSILPLFDRVIWKTTNFREDQTPSPTAPDTLGCPDPRLECMSLDWTKFLSPKDYWNSLHFQAPIYNDINIQFLHQLITKKPLEVAPLPEKYYGYIVLANGKQYLVDERGLLRLFQVVSDPFDREEERLQNCLQSLNNRTHVHMDVVALTHYLLGEMIPNVCNFTTWL